MASPVSQPTPQRQTTTNNTTQSAPTTSVPNSTSEVAGEIFSQITEVNELQTDKFWLKPEKENDTKIKVKSTGSWGKSVLDIIKNICTFGKHFATRANKTFESCKNLYSKLSQENISEEKFDKFKEKLNKNKFLTKKQKDEIKSWNLEKTSPPTRPSAPITEASPMENHVKKFLLNIEAIEKLNEKIDIKNIKGIVKSKEKLNKEIDVEEIINAIPAVVRNKFKEGENFSERDKVAYSFIDPYREVLIRNIKNAKSNKSEEEKFQDFLTQNKDQEIMDALLSSTQDEKLVKFLEKEIESLKNLKGIKQEDKDKIEEIAKKMSEGKMSDPTHTDLHKQIIKQLEKLNCVQIYNDARILGSDKSSQSVEKLNNFRKKVGKLNNKSIKENDIIKILDLTLEFDRSGRFILHNELINTFPGNQEIITYINKHRENRLRQLWNSVEPPPRFKK